MEAYTAGRKMIKAMEFRNKVICTQLRQDHKEFKVTLSYKANEDQLWLQEILSQNK